MAHTTVPDVAVDDFGKASWADAVRAADIDLTTRVEDLEAASIDLPLANLEQGAALSVVGVTGNATADHASIVASSDGQVLRRSGTALGFGAVDLANANAITGALPLANLPSTLAQILKATVTLTDAQVKALPTTAITVVAAPSAGNRNKLISATLSLDASSGAYTNIDTTNAFLGIISDGGFESIFAANDSATTPALTTVSDFLGVAADNLIDLVANTRPRGQVSTGVLYHQPRIFSTSYVAGALKVSLDNNGTGNLTGGNAANTLKVTVYYAIEAI